MKLINMRLKDEPLAIYIEADGQIWDLHNAFALESITQNIDERSVSLRWQLSRYGELPVPAEGAEIMFGGVDYFDVTPRDPEISDFAQGTCLEGLTRVPPEDDTRYLVANGVPWLDSEEERFHLWFAFRDGQRIRVGAETATFKITYKNDAE